MRWKTANVSFRVYIPKSYSKSKCKSARTHTHMHKPYFRLIEGEMLRGPPPSLSLSLSPPSPSQNTTTQSQTQHNRFFIQE